MINKIINWSRNAGLILACVFGVVYLVVIGVMIAGFNAYTTFEETFVFALINLFFGIAIAISCHCFGRDKAKELPENKKIMDELFAKKPKKEHKPIYYEVLSIVKIVFTKGLFAVISTSLTIYLVIEGSKDLMMLVLALSNLCMWSAFGFYEISKAYDNFNTKQITYYKRLLEVKKDERM